MAVVHCQTNGLVLKLHERVLGPLDVIEHRHTGESLQLSSGRNEVDDAFWKAWLEQNPKSSLLGAVLVEEHGNE